MIQSCRMRVCIVGPFPPRIGGIASHDQVLFDSLARDSSFAAFRARENYRAPHKFLAELIIGLMNCDLVHIQSVSYFWFMTTAMVALFAKILGKTVVVTYHGGAAGRFFRTWFGYVARTILARVDAMSVPSQCMRRTFEAFGLRTEVLPNLFGLDLFKYVERNCIRPKILFVKHLEEFYGCEDALRAFAEVKKKYPSAQLKIVGSGSLERHLKILTKELNLADVEFTGRIPHKEMVSVFNESDIFLNVPRMEESFGIVILEAFASGLPVIATHLGGPADLIVDQKTGLLVRPNSPESIANKILYLLGEPAFALNLAENARKSVNRFTWNAVRPMIIRFYEQAQMRNVRSNRSMRRIC